MSIQVKSIDVHAIHDRLRADKTKEGKEVWNYVKKLNEALKKQQELTGLAISKLRNPPDESPSLSVPIDQEASIALNKIHNLCITGGEFTPEELIEKIEVLARDYENTENAGKDGRIVEAEKILFAYLDEHYKGFSEDAKWLRTLQFPLKAVIAAMREYADQQSPSQPSWVSVVKELVELKDMAESGVIDDYRRIKEFADYSFRKPLAWEAARELLKTVNL